MNEFTGQPPETATDDKVPEPIDPHSPRALMVPAGTTGSSMKPLLTVPTRWKPGKLVFFRVRPDDGFSGDCYAVEDDGITYIVQPEYAEALGVTVQFVRVFTCIDNYANPFLWLCKLPKPDSNTGRDWAESALRIAELAKTRWLWMAGNVRLGAYEHREAEGSFPEPKWPDKSFDELWKLAFPKAELFIDHPDHPFIRKTRGLL